MTIWVASTDSNLSLDERKAQRKTIEDNGFEFYARFNDEVIARKWAKMIKLHTNVELVVSPVYPTSIRV